MFLVFSLTSDFIAVSLLVLISESNTACTDLTQHPAWKILNQFECGESANDRIIGGANAALGQFPWIARLGYSENDGDGAVSLDFGCGGSLITDRHVLTAAHCLAIGYEKLTVIRLGEYDIRTNPDCVNGVCAPPVQDRRPKKIAIHPGFNTPRYHFDIAMILLDKPVNINFYVAPICLPFGKDMGVHIGDRVTVAGWGKMNITTERRADVLQTLQITVIEHDKCNNKAFKISQGEICAGAELNKDTCNGDSGGPLMVVRDTPDGPKYILEGVVSVGPALCGNRIPGIYASVSYFLPWILDNVVALK